MTPVRSLLELTRLADELVEPFKKSGAYKTKALLMKALECIEVYKANNDSKDSGKCEESFICYTAASKLVSEIIPGTNGFESLNESTDLGQFYNDLVDYLVRKRPQYDSIRMYLQSRARVQKPTMAELSNHSSGDSLMLRFRSLKNGNPSNKSDGSDFLKSLSTQSFITVEQLSKALLNFGSSIFLIDFRRKREFDLDHITLTDNIIQLDPVSVRENYSCQDIADYSMVTNTDHQKKLFLTRSNFKLVVCMDSTSSENHISPKLQRLVHILRLEDKSNPLILDGGFQRWEAVNDHIGIPATVDHSIESDDTSSMVSTSYNERRLIRNVSEYFAAPKTSSSSDTVHSYAYSSSPSPIPSFQMPSQQHRLAPSLPRKPSTMPPTIPSTMPPTLARNHDVTIMTGLVNLHNSCYLNSGLQCLMGTRKLIQFFLNGNYRKHINMNSRLGSKGILANEFASLCTQMFRSTNESKPAYINPIHFRRVLASLNSTFDNCDQQDCAEFLTYLVDSLHEDLNENGNHPKLPELGKEEEQQREALPIRIASTIEWERYLKTNFSIIVDIFEGQMMSLLKCLRCGDTSTTYNSFSTLSLPIPKSRTDQSLTLEDCFNEFVRPEILDGDDKWFCPRCKSKQKSIKHLRISRLPQVLCVHLKRFRMDNYLSKINNYVGYPENLQLDKYWPQVKSDFERAELSKLPVRGQVPPFNYKLFGVINHYGNLINGHYTAYVKKHRHGWCLFDDQNVYKHCRTSKVVNGDAYILFYERK
ncbi:hypothetical protein FOA43_004260 [Brettanomyces nanus]|uniref:ubiquitinyl hydrolase 1 n=1 Tax=Eeniella nana TaxID=13502 RepID=A0A875S6A2_EENNA|nr:uncharacterized protein FOA43_004260 [Brettanomyces nanus]QPG76866.1 hypothetical protein FOA43_004260 [Brettanomyces nanus]